MATATKTPTPTTNQQFADAIGVHFSMASRIRAGKRLPGLDTLQRIAAAYEIPLQTLVTARNKGAEEFGKLVRRRIFRVRS